MSCDERCERAKWETTGIELARREPRYPDTGVLIASLCIFYGGVGLSNHSLRMWLDVVAIVVGVALWVRLSLWHRGRMRAWRVEYEAYWRATGKAPGEDLS